MAFCLLICIKADHCVSGTAALFSLAFAALTHHWVVCKLRLSSSPPRSMADRLCCWHAFFIMTEVVVSKILYPLHRLLTRPFPPPKETLCWCLLRYVGFRIYGRHVWIDQHENESNHYICCDLAYREVISDTVILRHLKCFRLSKDKGSCEVWSVHAPLIGHNTVKPTLSFSCS